MTESANDDPANDLDPAEPTQESAELDGRRYPSTAPSNHSPHAAFDDRTLPDGAALYAELATRQLTQPSA